MLDAGRFEEFDATEKDQASYIVQCYLYLNVFLKIVLV